jgi:fluoride ion exporter CrcB/FEX
VWVAQEANWLAETPHALTVRQAVTGGLCGGLTTLSSLCADAFRLARGFAPVASILYVALTIILGLAAFFAGSSLE